MTRRSSLCDYRAGARFGEVSRGLFGGLFLAAASLALGGCSITMPMFASKSADEEPEAAQTTASVAQPVAAASLTRELGPEDQRRAFGAMGLALDPQGNGAPVAWSNKESGLKGEFTPVGGPFLKSDEICRVFIVSTVLQNGQDWRQGMACRLSGGEWSIREIKPFQKP